jgi:hypothetical protein
VPGHPLKVGALTGMQCRSGVSFAMRVHYVSFKTSPSA